MDVWWRKKWIGYELARAAVRDGNRDGVWVELGVCTLGFSIGEVDVVRKLSGREMNLKGYGLERAAVRDGNRDGVWVELGVCTLVYTVEEVVGMVGKLSGAVMVRAVIYCDLWCFDGCSRDGCCCDFWC